MRTIRPRVVASILLAAAVWAAPTGAGPTIQSAGPEKCGNGFLDLGETCEACPQDCAVTSCTAGKPIRFYQIVLEPPPGENVSSVTIMIPYRGDVVSIPGSGPAAEVQNRVTHAPSGSLIAAHDWDNGIRVVLTDPSGLKPGPLFTVGFDSCANAPPPSDTAVRCVVEGCANSDRTFEDCGCSLRQQPPGQP
jgi:hypothetical protein